MVWMCKIMYTNYVTYRVSVNTQIDILTSVKYVQNVQNCLCNRLQQWVYIKILGQDVSIRPRFGL